MTGRAQVIEFAGFWALARCLLGNSILKIPSNREPRFFSLELMQRGILRWRPRERRETKEQDLFRSRNALAFDRSSLTHWRQRMGEDKLKARCRKAWRWRPGRTR